MDSDRSGGATAPGDDRSSGGSDGPWTGEPSVDLRVPDDATEEEAAAIAAAIEAYLAEERTAAGDASDHAWDGRRWSFAGRLGNLTGRAARVPSGVPTDAWSAAGRADRF